MEALKDNFVFCLTVGWILFVAAIVAVGIMFTDSESKLYKYRYCAWGLVAGLLDKNGKEVYEDDIATDGKYLYTVEFSTDSCSFVWSRHGSCSYNNFHFERQNDAEEMEIVGNIHDNPELISK